jgi:hypothetical protein
MKRVKDHYILMETSIGNIRVTWNPNEEDVAIDIIINNKNTNNACDIETAKKIAHDHIAYIHAILSQYLSTEGTPLKPFYNTENG